MKILGKRVMVEDLNKHNDEEISKGGIVIPGSVVKHKTIRKGQIIEVGQNLKDISKGQKVIFLKDINNSKGQIIDIENVLLILKDKIKKPIGKWIRIKRLTLDEEELQTASGIHFKEDYKKRDDMAPNMLHGEVVELGGEAKKEIKVNVGDEVWYNPFDSYEFEEEDICVWEGIRLQRKKVV